MRASCAPS
jgi:hypothetical protein